MSEQKYPNLCPKCGSEMIDDAWELIDFLPNGDIQMNPISPAWVCSKWCGFYIEIAEDFYQ